MRCWAIHIIAILMALTSCATTADTERTAADKSAVASNKNRAGKKKKKKKKKRKKTASGKRKRGLSSDVPRTYKPRKTACEKYESMVARIAEEHDLEPELVMGLIKVESSFEPKCTSRVGATGLMQIMPRTAKHMKCGNDLTDPETNVECGCKVLRRYLDIYDGNLIYGLAAYNAGPGNANPSARGSYLPFNFAYVEKIFRWRNVFVRFGCK